MNNNNIKIINILKNQTIKNINNKINDIPLGTKLNIRKKKIKEIIDNAQTDFIIEINEYKCKKTQ